MCSKGVLLFISLLGCCDIVDSACTFPSELQNADWISSLTDTTTSAYSTLTFTTSNLTIDFYLSYSNFFCFVTDGGNKYVLQSNLLISNSFGNYYSYLCFDFRRQNAYSYAFYVLSHTRSLSAYYKSLAQNFAASVDNICDQTKGDGEYYVLIKKNFETSAQQTCITPLLGVFYYSQISNVTTCASGKWDICNSNSTQIAVNRTSLTSSTLCFTNPGNLATATGYILCIASVSGTYYYQTTYLVSTKTFVCMTVGYSGSNVLVTQVSKSCEYAQTPTYVSSSGTYFTLVVNETCVSAQSSTSGQTNAGLIVGVVVVVVVLLAIVCGVLWYKLYWVPKKKGSFTIITENRREKFQDPYLEEKDKKSTITREDVLFDMEDTDSITHTAPNITIEGDTQDSTTKVANGHVVTQGNGYVPNNGDIIEGPTSVSPYMEDPEAMEDSSSINKRPGKFKSLDLDEELSSHPETISEVVDEDKPAVTTTTKLTNISVTAPSVPESLTPVMGEI
ncbi:hypothetical protein CHS0354_011867 [Potamilus streckersoni]|uniref:Uncharacterized protein n=1 Tax=Potamilus streckersoni TaxID=2493646 RepID=A0AAE0W8J4_9BIVA|nr:hypothetical protein CHS0354_011867 [Potamilus streckersoni]